MKNVIAIASGMTVAAIFAAPPAIAGTFVPGPVLGAGAPALVGIAGGYWLIRRLRRG
jgi:hypothetical protein